MAHARQWEVDPYQSEEESVRNLLRSSATIAIVARQAMVEDGQKLVRSVREMPGRRPVLDEFLQEFGLSNPEGVALMCLAESLLRIPDSETADRLIAEKVHAGDWTTHRGRSTSLFVNASVWGMLLTGKIVKLEPAITRRPAKWLGRLVSRLGEPTVRTAMHQAMRLLGRQYVLGRNIGEALKRGLSGYAAGTLFSFDMLGEAALTASDAERYFEHYAEAINAVGRANQQRTNRSDSVSIKLSALHPCYRERQRERVMQELLPRLMQLAISARDGGVALTIDAEESERLNLSLDLFDRMSQHPDLADWDGLGLVVQAYQKRAPAVIDRISKLARQTGRRIPVRLVKGAYWDSEIKRAQELGLVDYPVYTNKHNTDLAWLVCAKKLIEAGAVILPQFATHNAFSLAAILHLTSDKQEFELQRLHGMGDLLYEALREHCQRKDIPLPPVRVYAPVGAHRELLPYLVRRLLENGASSSFATQLLDADVAVDILVQDVVAQVTNGALREPTIPRPPELFLDSETPRANAPGLNVEDRRQLALLVNEVSCFSKNRYQAKPTNLTDKAAVDELPIKCPAALQEVIGNCRPSSPADVTNAMASAAQAQPAWNALGAKHRADILENVGRMLVEHRAELIHLICREAGRTLDDSLSEVREAIDFCNYYATIARQHFAQPLNLTSPTGELNQLSMHGRGVFACISPWNFPLAILTGQATAALAAGNTVVAKPAEQTSLIATRLAKLMHAAGVPKEVFQVLPGEGGIVGTAILKDERLTGVAFTGSTDTAKLIQRVLADRNGPILPLIAETGGINAMIADSSSLPEQLVHDVVASAFLSAGQRCSALRVLFLPEAIADQVVEMIAGACDELRIGLPWDAATDVGPVIDCASLFSLNEYVAQLRKTATLHYAFPDSRLPSEGYFFGPHIFEIESMAALKREVFGPVLHVVRYQVGELESVIEQINESGFGLTLGVHSRIARWAEEIFEKTRAGNTYVNRNMVGAVVGVNPFGGHGLSGTGPKAGGPHYLFRFATERTLTVNTAAAGGNVELLTSTKRLGRAVDTQDCPPIAVPAFLDERDFKSTEIEELSIVERGYN